MPNYTQGSTRVELKQPDLDTQIRNGSVVLDSRRTRPLWFEGRFMAARDLEREQNYYLQREADLGQAAGFEVLNGLMVDLVPTITASVVQQRPETIRIRAGYGVTPAGELVTVPKAVTIRLSAIPEERPLDLQIGVAQLSPQSAQNRNGLYVVALRPVEFTANPITSFPTTVLGARTAHDGNIVEATVIALVPYPNPPRNFSTQLEEAAVARQSFVTGSGGRLSDSLLPLAMLRLNQGAINWIDPYLVRRDTGPEFGGVRFGLTDAASQQAYLAQFDTQLQSVVATRQNSGLKANFAAADYFQSLPPVGRFPLDAIDTSAFSQVFFPQQMDVRLSIIPSDELPALLEDGMSLPPIDLTLPEDAYANIGVLALVPVPRENFLSLKNSLPLVPLNPTLPQVLANRSPLQLLRLFKGSVIVKLPPPVADSAWAAAIGAQKFGFFVRRRTETKLAPFKTPSIAVLSSSLNPSPEGQAVTFTAVVSPAPSGGTVTFFDGTTALGSPTPPSSGIFTLTTSTLSVGTHPVTAQFSGDSGHLPATSQVVVQTVVKVTSRTTLTSSLNPSTAGQAVTFNATVTPTAATGSVQFMDGGTPLASPVTLSGGTASFTTSTLAVGSHSITAIYSGDATTAASTSTTVTQVVNRVATNTTLTSSANPSTAGQNVTFTATVSPTPAGGTVQFSDGTTPLAPPVTVTAGVATFATSTLSVGTHSITAVYSGNASSLGSASIPVAQTVNRNSSSVALRSSVNPSTTGQNVTFTARVNPSSATGTVTFLDGTTPLNAPVTVTGGIATLTISTLSVGTHSITASYSGDASDTQSTSNVVAQTVNRIGSGVVVTTSLNPSVVGQAVTFTARVSPPTATGTIQFLDGTTALGTPAAVTGGAANLTTNALTAGTHSIGASYSGDANDTPSNATAISQIVNQVNATVAVSSSANPSTVGQSVTFTARISPPSATGTVQFNNGTAPLGGPVTVSGGLATTTSSNLPAGVHSITATYSGDSNNTSGTSPTLSQTVNRINSVVTLGSSVNPSTAGQSVTFTANVNPTSATGTMTFLDGGTALGPPVNQASGAWTFATSALAVGSHSITAAYSGDANTSPNTSAAVAQVVNRTNSSVAVSSSANPSTVQQPVTFTARVTPNSASGSVQFLDGTTPLGTPAPISAGAASVTSGALTVGTHSITAAYRGDGNNNASTSASLSQVVNRVNSDVALTSSANPSTVGQSVTFTARVVPAAATGTVQFVDGTTPLGPAVALSGGIANLPIASLSVGSHSITAVYSGDANNNGDTSPVVAQTVNRINSSLALSSSANPSAAQQQVTFTARINPTSATGQVQFQDGANPLGPPANVSAGVATMNISTLAVGSHPITAAYSGDANDTPSTSPPVAQVVNRIDSSVAVTSSANPSTVQQPVTFTARITPSSATGTVRFSDGTAPLGVPVDVTGGNARLTTTQLQVGTHTIIATYSGDANDAPATSPAVAQVVNRANSTVVLTSSANPSLVGQPVTITASITPNSATGNVVFTLLDATGAQVTITAVVNNGAASMNTPNLSVGPHVINASYGGDANTNASNAAPLTQNVNLGATNVTLTATSNSSGVGQPVTFTATVTPNNATGTVQFLDGTAPLGAAVPLSTSGIAALSTPNLTLGQHTITASYSGNAANSPAVSAPLAHTVTQGNSSVTVGSSGNPSVVGQQVVFTARVTPPSATGTVQFRDGTVPLGGPVTIAPGAVASTTTPNLAAGAHSVTATYGGDANLIGSTSPPFVQTVNRVPSSVVVVSSLNPSGTGQPVTFTARISPSSARGTVQFRDGNANLGPPIDVNNGIATLTTQQLTTIAVHPITATYNGDASTAPSTSPPLAQNVLPIVG